MIFLHIVLAIMAVGLGATFAKSVFSEQVSSDGSIGLAVLCLLLSTDILPELSLQMTIRDLIKALRALVESSGHEGAGPNRCAFDTKGCSCGQIEKQRIALADANRLLREVK